MQILARLVIALVIVICAAECAVALSLLHRRRVAILAVAGPAGGGVLALVDVAIRIHPAMLEGAVRQAL